MNLRERWVSLTFARTYIKESFEYAWLWISCPPMEADKHQLLPVFYRREGRFLPNVCKPYDNLLGFFRYAVQSIQSIEGVPQIAAIAVLTSPQNKLPMTSSPVGVSDCCARFRGRMRAGITGYSNEAIAVAATCTRITSRDGSASSRAGPIECDRSNAAGVSCIYGGIEDVRESP